MVMSQGHRYDTSTGPRDAPWGSGGVTWPAICVKDTNLLELRDDHTSMMGGCGVIHELEVRDILAPLGDDDGLDDLLQV